MNRYKSRYGEWAGFNGNPADLTRCCVEVAQPMGATTHFHQCSRKRGYGPDKAFCKIHDPVAVEARNTKSDQEYRVKQYARMGELCGPKFLKILREIADGHNDPRTLAAEAVKDFDMRYKP